MKKATTVCTLVAFILIIAGFFIFRSPVNNIYIQHRIYAPENSVVTFDGENVEYSDTLKCYPVIVTKEGKYNLSVAHEGCSTFETTVFIKDDSESNHETKADLFYTADFIAEGEKEAISLIEKIIRKCWNIDTDYSDLNFLTEEDKKLVTDILEGITEELAQNLSAEYTANNLKIVSTPFSTNKEQPPCRYDNADSSMMFAFLLEYTYTWDYKNPAYSDSGIEAVTHQPYIVIERIDGIWYIRDLYLTLSNKSK